MANINIKETEYKLQHVKAGSLNVHFELLQNYCIPVMHSMKPNDKDILLFEPVCTEIVS